ncbi:MAG: glycosyltransferase, partial [Chloroflexi bacterium]|nr:glycosyltransferase [Chloroflexota bacterium]
RVGGLVATISDGRTGYLVPWRCPEPFAEKIELLLRNEELRRALGRAAAERMRTYSWAEVARSVGSLLGAMASEPEEDCSVVAGGRLPA